MLFEKTLDFLIDRVFLTKEWLAFCLSAYIFWIIQTAPSGSLVLILAPIPIAIVALIAISYIIAPILAKEEPEDICHPIR